VTTLVFFLARPNSQTQPTTHTEYPHTPTDSHALQVTITVRYQKLHWTVHVTCDLFIFHEGDRGREGAEILILETLLLRRFNF